jgi:hypothetical protein
MSVNLPNYRSNGMNGNNGNNENKNNGKAHTAHAPKAKKAPRSKKATGPVRMDEDPSRRSSRTRKAPKNKNYEAIVASKANTKVNKAKGSRKVKLKKVSPERNEGGLNNIIGNLKGLSLGNHKPGKGSYLRIGKD